MMQFRNAHFNEHGTIDCEANHFKFGWIPMTLSPEDNATSEMYFEAESSAPAYVAPSEPNATATEI